MEVKYRKDESHGHPLDTFTLAKKRAMKRAVFLYAHKHHVDIDMVRIDFIAIMPDIT